MRKIAIIFLFILAFNLHAQDTKKALFIGNSYTYGNNLPDLVENLADANGDVFIHDQSTPGGYTFNSHSTNATTLDKISAEDWNYVILQAQSQEPSFPPSQVASQTKPYAEILCDSVYSNNECSKALFFMTWGRENGDAVNCPNYTPLCTYGGMQQRLRESYLEMAEENNASVAPVGMAWKKVRADFPSIDLYTSDGSHPNINGSYLAACVFYSSMYHKTTVGNTYWASLDSLTAFRLQDIASNTVLDSLDVWRIDTSAIIPIFKDSIVSVCDSFEINGNWFYSDTMFSDTINCGAEIINYEIDVIDESTEILFFSQIILLGGGSGNIMLQFEAVNYDSLILMKGTEILQKYYPPQNSLIEYEYVCDASQLEQTFTLNAKKMPCNDTIAMYTGVCQTVGIENLSKSDWTISPNPTHNFITIESKNKALFYSALKDISGREVIKKSLNSRIDLSSLDKGIYFVVIYDKDGNVIGQKRIVKN